MKVGLVNTMRSTSVHNIFIRFLLLLELTSLTLGCRASPYNGVLTPYMTQPRPFEIEASAPPGESVVAGAKRPDRHALAACPCLPRRPRSSPIIMAARNCL